MKKIWTILTSLRFTVILLGLAMALVFFGTLEQVEFGIYEVQKRYFKNILVFWSYPTQWPGSVYLSWIKIPLLGGYLLAILLLLNLICAHFKYFIPKWNKLGILLIHGGLVLLIISGLLTSFLQDEWQMVLVPGEKVNSVKSIRENEFVIIDRTNTDAIKTYSVDEEKLRKMGEMGLGGSPFSLKLEKFYANADLGLRSQNPEIKEKSLATHGAGVKMDIVVFPKEVTYRQDEVNVAVAYVTVKANEEDIGTWLVSTMIDDRFPPQRVIYEDGDYEIALRFKQKELPFSLKLLEFKHDTYPGTDIAKNFSSLVQIEDARDGTDRAVLIYMNNPLRYGGYSFYQASYEPGGASSILQVVKNPGWMFPYFGVILVGVGLFFHFVLHLVNYLRRKRG